MSALSVVIASVGRSGLTQILRDIHQSGSEIPIRIILVLDGVSPDDPNINVWKSLCSFVVITPNKVGASAAYSIGLKMVDSDHFRIFTDDDVWEHQALIDALSAIENGSVLVCKSLVHDEVGLHVRSSYFPQSASPLESVYSPILPWQRNKIYFHLTSMIFPVEASRILFNNELIIREDLEWLQRIFVAGIKFKFSNTVLGSVYPSHIRSAQRQSLEIDTDWASRLTLISPKVARNFVFFHCFRSFAVTGNPKEIILRIHPLVKIVGKPGFMEILALFMYISMAALKKIQKFLKSK